MGFKPVSAEDAEVANGKSIPHPETRPANRRQKPPFQFSDRPLLHFPPASPGYIGANGYPLHCPVVEEPLEPAGLTMAFVGRGSSGECLLGEAMEEQPAGL